MLLVAKFFGAVFFGAVFFGAVLSVRCCCDGVAHHKAKPRRSRTAGVLCPGIELLPKANSIHRPITYRDRFVDQNPCRFRLGLRIAKDRDE